MIMMGHVILTDYVQSTVVPGQKKASPPSLNCLEQNKIPIDDGGWIKPGKVGSPLIRQRKGRFYGNFPTHCNAIMEYRP